MNSWGAAASCASLTGPLEKPVVNDAFFDPTGK